MPSVEDQARAAVAGLSETLRQLIACVGRERELLRRQDYGTLLDETQLRQQLNARLGMLKSALDAGLAALGSPKALEPGYAEMMRLVRDLNVADTINRRLFTRTLGVVRAFRSALRPAPIAYDRRGARPASETYSSTSRRV